MTSDHRITPGLIHDILDALHRHGYVRGDDLHADRATGLIGDLARIWEGTQDDPAGAHLITVPSSRPAQPGPGGQAAPDGVVLAGGDIRTVVAALDVAAGYQRDRAEMCADCLGRSCATCQIRLRDAWAYDGMAAGWPGPPKPLKLPEPASPGQILRASPPLTRRPASEARPPETGQASQPPCSNAPDP